MNKVMVICAGSVVLAACAQMKTDTPNIVSASVTQTENHGPVRPRIRPRIYPTGAGTLPRAIPPKTARTVEEFDTTTAQERAEASSTGQISKDLGSTVISLGDPTLPGFWLKTPLVNQEIKGLVTFAGTGKSVQVTLIPIEGSITAGSRMSLAAIRVLGVSLIALTEVRVFRE